MTKAIKQKVEVTQYFLSLHMGAVLGSARWKKLKLADKLAWEGDVVENEIVTIKKPDLFGGIQQQGGFLSDVHFLNGNATQELPELLASKLGRTVANCPGFRGFTSFFFVEPADDPGPGGAIWAANSNTMPKISVTLEDLPDSWYPEKAGLPQIVAEAGQEGGEPVIPQGQYIFANSTVSDGQMALDFQNRRAYAFEADAGGDFMTIYDLGDPAHPVIDTLLLGWESDVSGSINGARYYPGDGLIYINLSLTSSSTIGTGQSIVAFNPVTRQIVSTNATVQPGTQTWGIFDVGGVTHLIINRLQGINSFRFDVYSFDGATFNLIGGSIFGDDPGIVAVGKRTATETTLFYQQNGDVYTLTITSSGGYTLNGMLFDPSVGTAGSMVYDPTDDTLINNAGLGASVVKYRLDDFTIVWSHPGNSGSSLVSDMQSRTINRVAVHSALDSRPVLIDMRTGEEVFNGFTGSGPTSAANKIFDDQTGSIYYPTNAGGTWRLVTSPLATTGDCFDANPVHIIHEVLTDTEYGLGVPVAKLDGAAFTAAADTVFAEGIGLSLLWSEQLTGEEFIDEILSHIEGVIYFDPHTGLIVLKLIRGDYDPASLRTITVDTAELASFRRKSLGETVNQLTVSYTNNENEEEASVTIQDLGNIAQQGEIVADTVTYAGVRSASLAMQLARRDLRVLSYPLATAEVTLDHSFWDIVPGEPIKLTWTFPNGDSIADMVMRVGEVTKGHKGRDEIQVKLTEDIFALPVAEFAIPPASLDTLDREAPRNLDYVAIFTLPYYLMVNEIDPDALDAVSDETGLTSPEAFAGIVAAQEGSDTTSYEVLAELVIDSLGTLDFVSQGTNGIVPRALADASLVAEAETILPIPAMTQGYPPAVGSFVLIGDGTEISSEFAIISSVDPGVSYTLKRGLMDTTPKLWPAGTQLWFINPAVNIVDDIIYAVPSSPDYKLLTITSQDTLAEEDAVTFIGSLDDRPYLPLRPADVQVEGVGFGSVSLVGLSTANVTWANRNRLTEDSVIKFWDDGDMTPEAGQTTIIQALDLNKTLLNEVTGLTGTSHAFPLTNFGAAEEGYIRVLSERDGFRSLQGHDIRVELLFELRTTNDGDIRELNDLDTRKVE